MGVLTKKYGLANRPFANDDEEKQEKKGPGGNLALPFESRVPNPESRVPNPESRI
jgi:hypothetical protein